MYVLFAGCRPGSQCSSSEEAWVLDLRTGEARRLMPDIARSWYVATGHLVLVRPEGSVFAVPFDLGSLEMRGAPVPVLEGVQVAEGISPDFAMSETGALLMLGGLGAAQSGTATVVSVNRRGVAVPIDPDWTFIPSPFQGAALSPDGTRLALNYSVDEIGEDLWVRQLGGGQVSRVTFRTAFDARPRWTPDGQSLTFISGRPGTMDLYVKRADGTGPAEKLLDLDRDIFEGRWSRDGTWLLIRTGGGTAARGGRDIWGIRPAIDSVPIPLAVAEWDEKAPALSPDGRWLAYESNETGTDEVCVRPFPDIDAGKLQVSINGGVAPAWAHNGRELFYVEPRGGRAMMVASIDTEPTFHVGEQQALFPLGSEYHLSSDYTAYDVAPDDDHFVIVRDFRGGEDRVKSTLIIVDNWFEELRAKVGN